MATTRSSRVSRARNTIPIPPRPSSASTSYSGARIARTRSRMVLMTAANVTVRESGKKNGPGDVPGPGGRRAGGAALLNFDGDPHSQRQMRRAVTLVCPLGRIREGHVIRLVGVRQERPGKVVHRVLHACLECCGTAGRNRVGPERDVVRPAGDVREAHGGARRNREGLRLERGARAAVSGHLHLDDRARRCGGCGGCGGGASGWRSRWSGLLRLVGFLSTGERADRHDRREQSETHCEIPPGLGEELLLVNRFTTPVNIDRRPQNGSPTKEPVY